MTFTSHLLTAQQRYEVAVWLARLESPQRTAELVEGVKVSQVEEIAHAIGFPTNEQRMNLAVQQFQSKPGVTRIDPEQLEAGQRLASSSASPSGPRSVGSERRLVDVADLHPDPSNPRTDAGDGVEDLAASIADVGLLQDIVARQDGDRLVVVAGHRRLAAVKHLGWDQVWTVIRPEMTRGQVLAAMISENSQRRDLDPIEQAHALAALRVAMGGQEVTHAMVAKRVGRNQVWVSDRLSLLELPREEQRKLRAGEMGLREAIGLSRIESGRARGHVPTRVPHLGASHPLSPLARNRCQRMGHPKGVRLASVACGECWEAVIRASERQDAIADSYEHGECAICRQTMPEAKVSAL
ncbi:ParB/RepB/Spo0J family partition protein [Calidifontibacter sp. DB0510]|uniref:ParB/RepB/Spo0J family partition protein n=1 Tax=Metallococcus carri TaxID=1656884 RepID=A0A967E8Z7_9MICO|nr:ParB/RepB/Spo0J family partition protein [Metallococcus carri]NHN55802.1 ParB/RepB/Spo0J family partition protein [Metallococcus carri]NOP38510.1 ParB/RepB/Spo0J family partition protein [Calidifontibacter sp. DB2511S]